MNATTLYAAVVEAHRTLRRYQARTPGDWSRDGHSLRTAQAVVDAARADYTAAFAAYAGAVA